MKNGFNIKTLIADSGYMSKENSALCQELGMTEAFIDFRVKTTEKHAKSNLWKESVKMWKEQKNVWHETALHVELLLKALVYNITIIGKYS